MDFIYGILKHIAYQEPIIIFFYYIGFTFIVVNIVNCVPRAIRNHHRRAARQKKFLHK